MNTISNKQQNSNKHKSGNKWEEYFFSTESRGTRNKDWFDRHGDGVDKDGKTIEFKGQVPYAMNSYLKKCCSDLTDDVKFVFTVPIFDAKTGKVSHNQLNKCVQVDTLIWGKTPVHGDVIEMYAATSRKFFIYETSDGRIMAAFYEYELISQETNAEMAAFLKSHSNSAKIIGDKSPYYKGK
jgi:hypothetical protein